MWPDVGLCCGTVRQASLLELLAIAGRHGFPTISATPQMVERSLASGVTVAQLRQRLAQEGVSISNLDALTRDVPGAAAVEDVPILWRQNWTYGLDDLLRMAVELNVPVINVTHFMGTPVSMDLMAAGMADLSIRAARHGRLLALEFMPDTSLPDITTAARVVQQAGAGNLGLMLDTWHLLRSGGSAADIRALPPGSLKGVQLNDRSSKAAPAHDTGYTLSERLLPGEGNAPLGEIIRAIVANTPGVSIEVEVFSSALAGIPPDKAALRVADALRAWRASTGLLEA